MDMTRPIVWSVAGSDSGGGAGLQADLRAFEALGVHGCTAVAAITAQNSMSVRQVAPVEAKLLDAQLAALAEDLPPAAIKTGLLGSVENIERLASWVLRLRERAPVALVVDPVGRASSGAWLSSEATRRALCERLLPLADVVTPNRAELGWLLGEAEPSACRVPQAARALAGSGARCVVTTGGDADDDAAHALDHLLSPQAEGWLALPRVATRHTHGSGCTFAASLASALALGFCEADAAVLAKMSTAQALRHSHAAGAGPGPVRPRAGFCLEGVTLPGLWTQPGEPGVAFPSTGSQPLGLYGIAADAAGIARLAAAGVRTLQLRIKDASGARLHREVRDAVACARRQGARLYINDHWALAIEHGAHGVHLGQEDLEGLAQADLQALAASGLRLGLSTHSLWELARAHALRPSYLACGPVHPTRTKAMPWRPQGPHNLAWWCAVQPLPVVAIGGLDAVRAAEAVRCGADGLAVLSGLADASDPAEVAARYEAAIAAARALARISAPALPRPSLAWLHMPE